MSQLVTAVQTASFQTNGAPLPVFALILARLQLGCKNKSRTGFAWIHALVRRV